MIEPLVLSFEVACGVEHAFTTWTAKINTWWPTDHTVTGAPEVVVLEPEVGGRIFERAANGEEHDWGEITQWDPPVRFGYLWHLMSKRDDATSVEVRFSPLSDRTTRVDIVHTGWERLGERAQDWRDQNSGGWSGVLPHFVAEAEG